MDTQNLINALLGATCVTIGWFARELWTAIKELKSDLAKLREELPKTYVIREEYRQDMREIKEMLYKIVDKLDAKVDK